MKRGAKTQPRVEGRRGASSTSLPDLARIAYALLVATRRYGDVTRAWSRIHDAARTVGAGYWTAEDADDPDIHHAIAHGREVDGALCGAVLRPGVCMRRVITCERCARRLAERIEVQE